jgi:hypothetical protein
VSDMEDIAPAELRAMLREHALIVGPGETLVVTVPPDWSPQTVRDLNDALGAVSFDMGFQTLVTPGTAVTVEHLPEVDGVTTPMSEATRYGGLAFALCSLLDEGAALNVSETLAHLEDGTLFGWLGETFRADLNLNLFSPADLDAMLAQFRSLHSAASASRAFGVERNGLALLLAWCLAGLYETRSQPGPALCPAPARAAVEGRQSG